MSNQSEAALGKMQDKGIIAFPILPVILLSCTMRLTAGPQPPPPPPHLIGELHPVPDQDLEQGDHLVNQRLQGNCLTLNLRAAVAEIGVHSHEQEAMATATVIVCIRI
jgi:hypothetical protein